MMAAACGAAPGATTGVPGGGPSSGAAVTVAPGAPGDAGAMFGLAPDPHAPGVTYQPDVVFLEAGWRRSRSGLSPLATRRRGEWSVRTW